MTQTAIEFIEQAEAARFRIGVGSGGFTIRREFHLFELTEKINLDAVEASGRVVFQGVPRPEAWANLEPLFSWVDRPGETGGMRIVSLDLYQVEAEFVKQVKELEPEHHKRWAERELHLRAFEQKLTQEVNQDAGVAELTVEIEEIQARLGELEREREERRNRLRQEKQGRAEDYVYVAGGREI